MPVTIAQHCKRDPYLFCPPGGCAKGDCARFGPAVDQTHDQLLRSCQLPEPANRP